MEKYSNLSKIMNAEDHYKIEPCSKSKMKTTSFLRNLYLVLLATCFVFSGCIKEPHEEDDDNPPIDPTNELIMAADKEYYCPFDVVSVVLPQSEIILNAGEYEGKCGAENIKAIRLNETSDTLIFVVPNVTGIKEVTLSIEGKTAKTEIQIRELPDVSNPTEIINNLTAEINGVIENLDNLSDTLLTEENRELIGSMVNEYNNILAQLSEEDKLLFAQYYSRHLEEYSIDDNIEQSGVKTAKSLGVNMPQIDKLYSEKRYLFKQIILIGTLGYGFHCLLAIPDPTFLTKLAAIADGIILIERVVNFKNRISKLVNEPNIPVIDNELSSFSTYSSYHSSISKAASGYDFDIEDKGYVNVPHKILFRTMYSGDTGQGLPVVQSITQSIGQFQQVWSNAENLITRVKSIFGFKGSLSGRPKKIEQITDYKTVEILVKPSNLLSNPYHIMPGLYHPDFVNSTVFSPNDDLYSIVQFVHTPIPYNSHSLDEHSTVFSFQGIYKLRYYDENNWDRYFYVYSPKYTVRIHCPDRNPPEEP